MRRTLALLLPLLIPMAAASQQPLATLRDNHRVLLVFAPSDQDPRYVQQMKMLDHHGAEIKERDLVLISVVTQTGPRITSQTLREMRGPELSDQEQVLARHRFQVAPEAFAVVLLGKDGGEKLRAVAPVSIDRLNQTIDAMPMRKDEMRAQKPG